MSAVHDYMTELQIVDNASAETIRARKNALRDYARANGGKDEYDVPIHATETEIKKWVSAMRERNLKDRSVKNYMLLVSGFYNFLIESPDHACSHNPCARIYKRLPTGVVQTRRPYKTVMEVAGLIKSITHPRDRCIVTMFAKTGIRRGELVGLSVEDVDLHGGILHIRHHLDETTSKLLTGRKNGVSTDIPIDQELSKVLKVCLALRPRTNNTALFLTQNGVRMAGRDVGDRVGMWVTRHWGANGNGTAERIVPHWFRAFLTYGLSVNGCNPVVIAAIRGDRAAKIQDFYTMQILDFDKIREEYLKAVPVFGL